MRLRGPNNVGRAVQTDPTLLCHASATTKQKKYWELLAQKFDPFQTLRNNSEQFPTAVQTDATCNIQQFGSCWPILLRPFARGFRYVTDQFNDKLLVGLLAQLVKALHWYRVGQEPVKPDF